MVERFSHHPAKQKAAPPAAHCRLCGGTGFTHPLMPSGEPDISEVYPCPCSDRYEPTGTDETGEFLNIFWNEGKR